MNFGALWLTLLAPLPYWVLGLPWTDAERAKFSPLLGCVLAGLYAEWAMIVGLPVAPPVWLLIVASGAVAVYRRRQLGTALGDFVEWVPIYLVSVLAASLSPFPVLGSWSGDWLTMYRMGVAVTMGDLPSTMLARPPLFGAATAPLWSLESGLIPYQLMAAVASAGAVTATLHLIRFLRPNASRLLLVPLLISPFFLHHTAAAWPKMLAGGLILMAAIEAFRAHRWASAIPFALAVAVHEGYIIWAPCVLLCHAYGPDRFRGVMKAVAPMAVCGLLITGPLVFWVLGKYGLAAKVASNPSITDLEYSSLPFALKSALGVLTAFVGWEPLVVAARWLGHADATAPSIIAKEGYWLITCWITLQAGTLIGFLLPFVAAVREIRTSERPSALPPFGAWATAGIGIAVVLNGTLAGFYSNQGTMQNALVPLALGAYAYLVGQLQPLGRGALVPLRRVIRLTAVIGTLPWLLTNVATTVGLWLSASFRQRLLAGSEGDYQRVIDNHLQPLGLFAFPAVPCLCLALLLLWFLTRRKVMPASDTVVREPHRGMP